MRLSIGFEKRTQSRLAVPIKLEAMIDQGVHRIAAPLLEEGEGGEDQRPSLRSARLRQGDQAWMKRFFAEERFEVADIFGDVHPILGDAGVLDRVVELAAPPDMQRMR